LISFYEVQTYCSNLARYSFAPLPEPGRRLALV